MWHIIFHRIPGRKVDNFDLIAELRTLERLKMKLCFHQLLVSDDLIEGLHVEVKGEHLLDFLQLKLGVSAAAAW